MLAVTAKISLNERCLACLEVREGNGLQPGVFTCSAVSVISVSDCVLFCAMRWNSTQSLTDTTLTAEQVKTSGWNPVAFAISQTPLPSEVHISRGF